MYAEVNYYDVYIITVGPQEFSDSMTPDQLYSWLLSNQLPENDCKLIKGTGIIIIVVLCAHADV